MSIRKSTIRALLLVLSVTGLPLHAVAQDRIGRVVQAKGTVIATNAHRPTRFLERSDDIFPGDRITTHDQGFVQVRMMDSAIFRLHENTDFTFHEYAYDGPGGVQERAVMELKKGGMRTIDGFIGKQSRDEYRLETPHVAVAPLGTTYACAVDETGTFCGVADGGILVSNAVGTLRLGLGAPYDYMAARRGYAPAGTMQVPASLGPVMGLQNTFSGINAIIPPGASTRPNRSASVVTGNAAAAFRGASPGSRPGQTLPGSAAFPVPQPIHVVPRKTAATSNSTAPR